jgi:hypothetical protein
MISVDLVSADPRAEGALQGVDEPLKRSFPLLVTLPG